MSKSRKEKKKKRILDALDKGKLSNNKGIFVGTPFRLSRKDRKKSGWKTPILCGKMKYSEMIANAEEPKEEYDEWNSYRDGFRCNSDQNHLFKKRRGCSNISPEEIEESNKKIKKQIAIRKVKKRK